MTEFHNDEVDPREAKLPAWVRGILTSQRQAIRALKYEMDCLREDLDTARAALIPAEDVADAPVRWETDSGALPLAGEGYVAFQIHDGEVIFEVCGDAIRASASKGITIVPINVLTIDIVPLGLRRTTTSD